jgi:hypothetical protein
MSRFWVVATAGVRLKAFFVSQVLRCGRIAGGYERCLHLGGGGGMVKFFACDRLRENVDKG